MGGLWVYLLNGYGVNYNNVGMKNLGIKKEPSKINSMAL